MRACNLVHLATELRLAHGIIILMPLIPFVVLRRLLPNGLFAEWIH